MLYGNQVDVWNLNPSHKWWLDQHYKIGLSIGGEDPKRVPDVKKAI